MNIKQIKLIATTVFLSLLLASCKYSLSCELMNVSAFPISVSTLDNTGKVKKELGVVAPDESITIIDWGWHTLQTQHDTVVNNYFEPKPPDQCIEYRGFGPWASPIFQAALLPDDTLALDIECKGSSSSFPISPSGNPGITTQSR